MTANPMPPMIPMSGPTGSMPPQGHGRFKPVDPVRVLRTHAWWLVIALMVGGMLGTATWGVLRLTMPRYTSLMQLKVDEQIRDISQLNPSGYSETSRTIELRVMNEITRLRSQDILRATLEREDVRSTAWFRGFKNLEDALEDLSDDVLRITPISGTSLINVAARTPSKQDPPVIVNGLISVYMIRLNQEMGSLSNEQRQAYTNERRRLESDINRLNDRLRQFTAQHQITSLDLRLNDAQQLAQLYTGQIADLQMEYDSISETHKMLMERQQTGDLEPSPEDISLVNQMPEVTTIQQRLDQYRESLEDSRNRLGENHYNSRNLRSRITATEQELELKRQQKLREMQASRIASYANALNTTQARIASLQEKLAESSARLNDLQQKLTEYNQIQTQLDEANERMKVIESLLSDQRVAIEHPGSRPVKRLTGTTEPELTFPLPEIVIPGVTLLVLVVATGLIFLYEMLDQRVKAPADVKLIQDVELLGTLPDAAEDPSGPTGIERVVEKYPAGLMAESFRDVRTAVMNKMDRRGYKTLMLVAAQPRSGTSSVTANLATSLAFHGRNVAIIDANFRRPAQHKLFDIANEAGLVDVLRGRRSIDQCIRKIDGISVSVLTTGQAADAPPELLEGGAFRAVIGELESKFDVVLIDAPPALLASDSQLLAKHVDAIATVVRAVNDKRGMIERMTRRLGGQRADLLGVILNGVQSAAGGYFRKSYREFYRYRENGAEDRLAASDRTSVAKHADSR